MEKPLYTQLRDIARRGGCLIVEAGDYLPTQLKEIALFGKATGSKLVIRHAYKILHTQCQEIASANPGNVYFDFTEDNCSK